MAIEWNLLDDLAAAAHGELSELEKARPAEASEVAAPRKIFAELLTIVLGNLYGKTPIPGTLYDRAMLKPVMTGIDDGEVMERFARCYANQQASPELRRLARALGSYFLSRG